jgi:paraquat-inducible protein B
VDKEPYPVFPTVPSPFSQITANTTSFLATLSRLPLDDPVASANSFVKDADALLRVPADGELTGDAAAAREQLSQAPLQQLVASVTRTLAGIDAVIGSPEAKRLPAGIAESLAQLNATLKTTRNLLEGDSSVSPLYFELSNTLQELTRAARAVRSLTETLEDKPNALIFGK